MLSSTVIKILKEGKGYRCEGISALGSKKLKPSDVVRFEVEELGNDHETALRQYCDGLDLSKNQCTFKNIYNTLQKKYDDTHNVLWLTTKQSAKTRYCDPGEQPIQYTVPSDSKIIQDLDIEGVLLLIPKR